MKIKPEFVTSILSIFAPICLIVSLTINKNKSRLVTIFSIIPMCPLAIYILLLIPYLMYR